MSLNSITFKRHIYFLPEDDLINEVYIPSLKYSRFYFGMIGFFSSNSLKELAPGLANFLIYPDSKMKLIISPYISQDDYKAIEDGIKTRNQIVEDKFSELFNFDTLDENRLINHTLDCFAYLIANERLELKIALLSKGLFHSKVKIFSDGMNTLVAHGSSNLTYSGLTSNFEQVSLNASWMGDKDLEIVTRFEEKFSFLWNGKNLKGITIFDLPEAIKKNLLKKYKRENPPTFKEYEEALNQENEIEDVFFQKEKRTFSIPDYLNYTSGDFAHQGEAVDAWLMNENHGILEMATGSGKTITALIATYKLFKKVKSLLIVIAVPYKPLLLQWGEEAKNFNLSTIVFDRATKSQKLNDITQIVSKLKLGISDSECIVITHDFLCSIDFQNIFHDQEINTLLIADEVHNLGRNEFVSNPPDFFTWRLGLSATPVRQFDEEGTEFLNKFFGNTVYQFGLDKAIGNCLVPYNYFIHPVNLSESELFDYLELTEKIKKSGWMQDEEDKSEYVNSLLRKRRLILENAESKISELRCILTEIDIRSQHHCLIYTSDKLPEQLDAVNHILRELGASYHQITSVESSDSFLTSNIFNNFRNGQLQFLTAKRVLDEGVNIPEIVTAFILASTTVERQWIQRRGRVLRKCKSIGKKIANIHDFLVLPPEKENRIDTDTKKIIKFELNRIDEFAKLSNNTAVSGGPMDIIHSIFNKYFFN